MDIFNKALKLKIPSLTEEVRDMIAGAVLLVFSIFTYLSSFPIKQTAVSKIGSDFFPKMISLLLLGIGLFILVNAIIRYGKTRGKEADKSGGEIEFDSSIILTPLLILIYFALTVYLGFVLTTILYLNLQVRVMHHNGKVNRLFVLLLSIVFTLTVYFGFIYGFRLYLPFGKIPEMIW